MSWERIYDDIDDEIASLVKAGMEDTAPYYQSHDWEELIEEYRSKIRADERKRIVAWLRRTEGAHDDINGRAARTFAELIEKGIPS